MQNVMPGLYASGPMTPDFAPQFYFRAFLLQRSNANVLLYANEHVSAGDADVQRLGGLSRIYLSHWHEVLFGAAKIGAPVHVPEDDRAEAEAKQCPIAGTFHGDQVLDGQVLDGHVLDGDIETIAIPGHTPGSTAFRVTIDGKRCLFSGDTLYLADAGWGVAVLPSSDRQAYLESLARLRATAFDVLIPLLAPAGAPCFQIVDEAQRLEQIDKVMERVRNGAER